MTEIDLVLQRLADADPAPADDAPLPGRSSSVLFDTICERSGEMSSTVLTPFWKRGPVVAMAIFVLIIGAGAVIFMAGAEESGTDASAGTAESTSIPTTVATTVATTAEPTTAALEPHESAIALWKARYGPDSDPIVWRSFLSDDSPAFEPIEWEWLADFDGDSVVALADWMQFEISMNQAMGVSADYECEPVSADTARCVVASTDAFLQLGGEEKPSTEVLMTFADGKLAGEEVVEPEDPDKYFELEGIAMDARHEALAGYEQWVNDTYPDRYRELFEEPCCDVVWVTLPAAIAEHETLMLEYLELAASGEAELLFDIEIVQADPEEVGNPFTASGAGVDERLFCDSGTTEMFNYLYSSEEQSEVWEEVLTCADGSGMVRIQVSASFLTVDGNRVKYSGGWKVIEGSGAYVNLGGNGRISNGDDYEGPFFFNGELNAAP